MVGLNGQCWLGLVLGAHFKGHFYGQEIAVILTCFYRQKPTTKQQQIAAAARADQCVLVGENGCSPSQNTTAQRGDHCTKIALLFFRSA